MAPLRADRDFAPEDVEIFLKAGYWNDDTLGDWLRHWSEEDPDGPQIIGLEGTLTNREVYDRAQRMAGALQSLGIVKGQAIGIQMAPRRLSGTCLQRERSTTEIIQVRHRLLTN